MVATALGPLLGVAAGSFVATNVDNLMVAAAQVAARPTRTRAILEGQLLGAGVVVLAAAVGGTVLVTVPVRWVGLLGLVPLAMGLRQLVRWVRVRRLPTGSEGAGRWPLARGLITSTLVTLGLSADNLAVYLPLFREATLVDRLAVIALLVALDLVLCVGAAAAGRHPAVVRAVNRAGPAARPLLFVAIGLVVVVRAGTFSGL